MKVPAPAHNYWFILGRESQISCAEILSVLKTKKYEATSFFLKVDDKNIFSRELIKNLGGTIKIAKELAEHISLAEMTQIMIAELETVTGKINFGLSLYSTEKNDYGNLKFTKDLGIQIKKALKTMGRSVRYVENRDPILSSVTVDKNNLTLRGREFIIEKHQSNLFSLAKTEAVQPFEDFSARDFGRPGRDDVSGMLPPKLAMMMINLAEIKQNQVLLDPFCGSGTILSEALLLGYEHLIGSDISEKAIADTEKNLEWTKQQFTFNDAHSTITLYTSQIAKLDTKIKSGSIDAIVAEPYMGRPLKGNEKKEELITQAAELKKLYVESFSQFAKMLRAGGKVVFLIPRFKYQEEWVRIDCEKEIEKLGFRSVKLFADKPFLVYARPNQRVAREIWRFEKIKEEK